MSYKHPKEREYMPTQQDIVEECARIRQGWDKKTRLRRKKREQGAVHWMPPVLLKIVNYRGECVCIMGE